MSSTRIVQTGSKPWGVLMLDTRFPRWKGDIGCPDGWPVELRYRKVKGMFPKEIVRSSETLQQHDVLPLFVKAAEDLMTQGIGGITTSCGFLVLLQNELQSRLPVPVITSSLLLLPHLLTENATVGVLTMDEHALGDAHFLAAGDRLCKISLLCQSASSISMGIFKRSPAGLSWLYAFSNIPAI